jgi:hypothetical protein
MHLASLIYGRGHDSPPFLIIATRWLVIFAGADNAGTTGSKPGVTYSIMAATPIKNCASAVFGSTKF